MNNSKFKKAKIENFKIRKKIEFILIICIFPFNLFMCGMLNNSPFKI